MPQYPTGTKILRDIAYGRGADPRQRLDLYLPPRPNGAMVVWIHGGGWEGGDKSANGAVAAVWAGFAVASVGYRLTQTAPFPAQLDDCSAAIRFLKTNAERWGLDASRIGVWGASAGGHLAALVGLTGLGVKAVCDYYGPTDITLYGASRPGDTLSKLVGGPIQDNVVKARRASPMYYDAKGAPPFLICHGDRDPLVPLEHSKRLADKLRAAGVPVTLKVIPGAGHGFGGPNDPSREVVAFFQRHLSRNS